MTAFFFVPGSEIIFTIIGIVVMICFFGSAIGRLFGGAGTDMLGKPIHVEVSKSANGKLVVRNAKYICAISVIKLILKIIQIMVNII